MEISHYKTGGDQSLQNPGGGSHYKTGRSVNINQWEISHYKTGGDQSL